ncbi:CHRD domain-containing protein [Archangium lansingense]|uniref:CHRD domain-containing protein n=1 Tax=Archangium lansingense TaxID=2995310 RepID=A0ABT3ZWC5_9BACT|nr:CHRD domain-containing protein [Archangium lansinium]MCY1073700.1 CHRD domain-containing protein [Archangium lansinium]
MRDTKRWAVLAVLGAGLLGMTGCGKSSVSTTTLKGENEVPPVTTTASGTANATLDGDELSVNGTFSGLSSALHEVSGSSAHVHNEAVGANGPIVFNLTVNASNGSFSGTKKLTDSEKDAFEAGRFYVNIHTMNHNEGEIRGQFSSILDE